MSLEPRDLVKVATSISSLPMIFTRINDAVNNPRSSIADIGRVISEDPGLTARLLRIVNSAFYRFPSKIDTISRALKRSTKMAFWTFMAGQTWGTIHHPSSRWRQC